MLYFFLLYFLLLYFSSLCISFIYTIVSINYICWVFLGIYRKGGGYLFVNVYDGVNIMLNNAIYLHI